ncbi:MAG: hypothetical protein ACPL3P_07540 [Anaerolineales bacterium]
MLRKIIFGALAGIVILAAGFSAYNVINGKAAELSQSSSTPMPTWGRAPQGQTNGSTSFNRGNGQALRQGNGVLASQNNSNILNTANGNGNRRHGQQFNTNGSRDAYATPNPQNGMGELLTFSGTVSNFAAPNFTLITSDGQTINAQLGNLNYVSSLGLSLTNGESVTVVGYWDPSGSFAVQKITDETTGQTYTLRDDLGRPLWRGGANH